MCWPGGGDYILHLVLLIQGFTNAICGGRDKGGDDDGDDDGHYAQDQARDGRPLFSEFACQSDDAENDGKWAENKRDESDDGDESEGDGHNAEDQRGDS